MSNKLSKALNKAIKATSKKARNKDVRTKAAIAADKTIKAKHPGKRKSADGNTYFESRANRSDKNRTKKFDEGGKPLGSTGLFGKGGKAIELPGTNLWLSGFGFDTNGNSVVKVGFTNDRTFSIQTNGTLPETHNIKRGIDKLDELRSGDLKIIAHEVYNYVSEYGSPKQKSKLKKYSSFEAGGKPLGSTGLFNDGGQVEYKVVDGTSYHKETPKAVIDVLENSLKTRKRIVLDYGDVKTGKSWGETNDVRGYVGRSTGTIKIPLLVSNSRSHGGGGILDHCILKISESAGGKVLYQIGNYKPADKFAEGGKPLGSTGLFEGGGSAISKEEYKNLRDEYDRLTDNYSDEEDEGEKKKLQLKISEVGDKIHRYERNYADGGKPLGSTGLFKKGGVIKYGDKIYSFKIKFDGVFVDRDVVANSKEEAIAMIEKEMEVKSSAIEYKGVKPVGGQYEAGIYIDRELAELSFADGGKPLGSTGLFAEGGEVKYDDAPAAHDVELFAENDQNLYRQSWIPILKNLKKKKDKGIFDVALAAKLMKYYVEAADKKYQKEQLGRQPKGFFLSVNDRKLLAKRLAESVKDMSDADMTFAKGGSVDTGDLFSKADDFAVEKLEALIDDNKGFGFEEYYNKTVVENETKHSSGFIPFTDGGHTITWFEYLNGLVDMGKRLPTKTLQAELQRQEDYAYNNTKNTFKEKYPEIVDEIGEENIDYTSLYDKGYEAEAEEFSEWEHDSMNDTIMFELGYYFYSPSNSRSLDGKPTCYVFAAINMESPYHRRGNQEDFEEDKFSFTTQKQFEAKFAKSLEKIKSWFEGDSEGRPLTLTHFDKGGSAAPATDDNNDSPATDSPIDNAPDIEMAKGGATAGERIINNEANQYSEHKLPFKGNNLEGKLLDNGDYVVLSYGYYPIWYWNSRELKWFGNSTKYSVTTSKQITQSRPDWNAQMLSNGELLEKMKTDEARFDLGGLMVQNLYPIGEKALPTDNTIIAHGAGTGIPE